MKLEKVIQFDYMNERYQVSCLSHNVNINVFGISVFDTTTQVVQLQ